MFGWGKRRGLSRRAFDNNVIIVKEDCSESDDGSRKKKPPKEKKPDDGSNGGDGGNGGRQTRCSPIQLSVTISFSVGLTSTIGTLLLALFFHAGARNPIDITVDHIAGSCLMRNSDVGDLASLAQQILPLKNTHPGEKTDREESEGATEEGSAITIYVPCPTYGNSDEGPDRGGGSSYPLERDNPDDLRLRRGGRDEQQ